MGLSIFGANEIAKNGCDYIGIIKYYFPKITINKYIKELSWESSIFSFLLNLLAPYQRLSLIQ